MDPKKRQREEGGRGGEEREGRRERESERLID